MKPFKRIACATGLVASLSFSLFGQTEIERTEMPLSPAFDAMSRNHGAASVELSEYDSLNRDALRAMAERDYKKAAMALRKALSLEPERSEAYVNYSIWHYDRSEYPQAEKAVMKGLEVDETDARAWHYYSKILILKGEPQNAIEAAERSVEYTKSKNWQYLKWLSELQYASDLFSASVNSSSKAIRVVDAQLSGVKQGIRVEESKEQVSNISHDTEVRAQFGGGTVEVPVTNFEYEGVDAPEEWYEMEEMLKEVRASIAFRKGAALKRLGKKAEAEEFIKLGFRGDENRLHEGLYQFVRHDFATSSELLSGPSKGPSPTLSCQLGYFLNQVGVGDSDESKRALKRLKRRANVEKAYWVADLLSYINEYDPAINSSGLKKGELSASDKAISSFYKAQFHFAQGYEDLAKPFLEKAMDGSLPEGFESRAAELQLAGM